MMKDAIERTRNILEWIDRSLADAKITAREDPAPLAERIRTSAAAFHQVIEHAYAIERLYGDPPFYGSAFALLRPLFEGLIRGLWLLHSATPAQAKNFIEKDQLKFTLEELVRRVENAHPGFSGGQLSKVQEGAWSAMCSYAHGGALQIQRRIRELEICPNYTASELQEVLQAVRIFTLFAGFEIAVLSDREQVYKDILVKLGEEIDAYDKTQTPTD